MVYVTSHYSQVPRARPDECNGEFRQLRRLSKGKALRSLRAIHRHMGLCEWQMALRCHSHQHAQEVVM
jgi:hypothetical protein